MTNDAKERRIVLYMTREDEQNLAACIAKLALKNDGSPITISDAIREGLRRFAGART